MTTRLLLIDNDIDFIIGIKKALEETGEFRVSISANGVAATEALRRGEHDCAVMGFELPDMDVMELLMQLRNVQPNLPVIMTPQTDVHHERARLLDIQSTINKPYSARDLIPYVRSLLTRASQPPAPPPSTGPDEFVPPQMPEALRHLVQPEPGPDPDGPTPTELLDQVEREKLGIEPGAPLPSSPDFLDDLETLDRIQTGELDAPPDDPAAALEAEAAAGTGAFDDQSGPGDTATLDWGEPEPRDTRPLDDEDDATAALGWREKQPRDTRPLDDQPEPEGTAALDWGDAEEPSDTRPLPEDMPEEGGTRVLDDQPELPGTTAMLDWSGADPGATRALDGEPGPPDTDALDWDPPREQTSRLADTDKLDEMERAGLTRPLDDEGPPPGTTTQLRWDTSTPDDGATRDLRDTDALDAALDHETRADRPAGFEIDQDSGFDEVLDAVAETADQDDQRSAEDGEFDDLVDSMREPEGPTRVPGSGLEDLLSALAAEAAQRRQDPDRAESDDEGGSALDFVLDAIRRGAPLSPEADEADVDEDATIGDVIDGLLDPSFEGVLAALAGEEVDEEAFEEPDYTGMPSQTRQESIEAADADQIAPDEMTVDDSPDWLTDYEPEGVEPAPPAEGREERPARAPVEEPPVGEEDSARYPATTALSAVSGTGEEDDFSLNDLLDQIEAELPPAPSSRPRLRPLPSWERDSTPEQAARLAEVFGTSAEDDESPAPAGQRDARKLSAMFDHMEGQAPPAPDLAEDADTLPEVFADEPEPEPASPAADLDDALTEVFGTADADELADVLDEGSPATPAIDEPPVEAGDTRPIAEPEPEAVADTGPLPALELPEDEPLPAPEDVAGDEVGQADEADEEQWLDAASQAALEQEQEALASPAPEDFPVPPEYVPDEGEAAADEAGPFDLDAVFGDDVGFDAEDAAADLDDYDGEEDAAILAEEEPELPGDLFAGDDAAEDEYDEADLDLGARLGPARTPSRPPQEVAPTDDDLAGTDEAVEEAFYEAVRETAEYDRVAVEDDAGIAEDDEAAAPLAEETGEQDAFDVAEPVAEARAEEPPAEAKPAAPEWEADIVDGDAYEGLVPPDDEHLVPVPVEEAARILEGAPAGEDARPAAPPDDEDDAELARIAVLLTQYSLESSAQAILLSRPGVRIAEAGDLPPAAMDRLTAIVDRAWSTGTGDTNSLIRYITLPDAGEFLLYSLLVDDDLALSMVFHANTPVRTIRRQARRLSESLTLVPEEPEIVPPEASPTLPSRPTDMRPPPGLREAAGDAPAAPDEQMPSRPPEDQVTYTAYGCLWLPFDPGLELVGELAEALYGWIEAIAEESAWELDGLDILGDYVAVAVRVPDTLQPDDVIGHLMDETARRAASAFPQAIQAGGKVWTDGYYVVSPPRDLSEREIARFITYQRQAQLG